jgi:hypothetical protein
MLEAAGEMRDAITYLRAELEYATSALRRAQHFAKADAIWAVVMRENALKMCEGIEATFKEFHANVAADAVGTVRLAIRAIPAPTHAEMLAHAMQLPEIKALAAACAMAWQGLVAEYGHYKARVNFCELEDALDALATLDAPK